MVMIEFHSLISDENPMIVLQMFDAITSSDLRKEHEIRKESLINHLFIYSRKEFVLETIKNFNNINRSFNSLQYSFNVNRDENFY